VANILTSLFKTEICTTVPSRWIPVAPKNVITAHLLMFPATPPTVSRLQLQVVLTVHA